MRFNYYTSLQYFISLNTYFLNCCNNCLMVERKNILLKIMQAVILKRRWIYFVISRRNLERFEWLCKWEICVININGNSYYKLFFIANFFLYLVHTCTLTSVQVLCFGHRQALGLKRLLFLSCLFTAAGQTHVYVYCRRSC